MARAFANEDCIADVDSRSLRDAGVAPVQAEFEANQPFWRRPGSLR